MTDELPQLQGMQGLEQFLLLAKTAQGSAAAQLIADVTGSPGERNIRFLFAQCCVSYIYLAILGINI